MGTTTPLKLIKPLATRVRRRECCPRAQRQKGVPTGVPTLPSKPKQGVGGWVEICE
jgi:hypothetical protein